MEELQYAKANKGGQLYNRDPIVPPLGSGTKEKPILVPSGLAVRAVGFEDPETHALYWFNIKRGPLHYIKNLDMYFKMDELEHNAEGGH